MPRKLLKIGCNFLKCFLEVFILLPPYIHRAANAAAWLNLDSEVVVLLLLGKKPTMLKRKLELQLLSSV